MKILFLTLKKTLFWSYERGSWQYDLMCVLILAFVFFGPNRLFHSVDAARIVTSEEVGPVETTRLRQVLSEYLSRKNGHAIEISGIETVVDNDSGKITYLVYEK